MHIVDWGEAQEADPILATCRRWLCTHKDTSFQKWDTLLRKYLGENANTEEGYTLFHMHNSLVMSKWLLYVSKQRMLALAQERFWGPMMVEDCQALV